MMRTVKATLLVIVLARFTFIAFRAALDALARRASKPNDHHQLRPR
jgi:hypothetical protein